MRRRVLASVGSPVEPYLRVEPQEVVWVNTDVSADYMVLSNTDWLVD